jgi:DNA topoisomerase-1
LPATAPPEVSPTVPARKKPAPDAAAPKKAPAKKAASTAVSKAPARKRPAPEATDAPAPTTPRGGYDLVIIESAGKVKAISKYLGRGFKVLPSYGHVRDLATGKDKTVKEEVSGIQIGNGWKMRYLVDAGSKAKNAKGRGKRRSQQQILDELAEAARGASKIYLAADPDREGESIAWHIADQLKLDPARTFRIRFNEITQKAIAQAMKDVGQIDMDRVKSQEARRAMDRVVGFPLSNLLGRKVAQGLSAGRVQSVVVKLIVDREAEIEAFKQEEYWKLTALLAPQGSGVKWTVRPELAKIMASKKSAVSGQQSAAEEDTKPKGDNGEELEDTEAASFEAEGEATPEQADQPKAKSGGDTKRIPPAPKGTFLAELAKWNGADPKLDSEAVIDAVVAELKSVPFVVSKVEQKDRTERPQPPFITSSLQQQAALRLRFNTRRTMGAAQQLYQGITLREVGAVALITYMRTDSTRISPDAVTAVRGYISDTFGPRYCPEKPNFYASGKSAQEAHECVRPTDVTMTPQRAESLGLSGDELKVYTLIYNRFVACQMAPAVFAITTVEVTAGKGLFRATGRIEKFDGYRRVMAPAKSEDVLLPAVQEKQTLDRLDQFASQHFTQPPPRYNEASLVKAMEKEGIGRPSTYSSTLETIQDRGYVEQRDRRFYPTAVGKTVTRLLAEHFKKVMDLKFTRHFEEELDGIQTGEHTFEGVLDEFWKEFHELLVKADTDMPSQKGIEIGEACPKCGRPLLAMFSRKTGNQFIGCSGWKDEESPCPYKRGEDGKESMGPEVTDIVCPACGKFMVKKDGRFGTFFTCEGAPDCPTIMNLGADGKPVVSTLPSPAKCPQCGKHQLLLKFSKTGNRYVQCPDAKGCKFTADADEQGNPVPPPVTGIDCDKCGSPMTIKKSFRGPFLACTGYPKCRNAKSINAELREKLKDILPPPDAKQQPSDVPAVEVKEICPECAGPMTLRKSRFGGGKFFLSCAKYPKCKGTRQVTPEVQDQIAAATSGGGGGEPPY